ncbi:hypothetical protein [Cyanobacterium sp. Dongsha4]|uniref:hypothetical protein n=1 Tax=Cyanobacterium sp. DS4 TaxID=2878255 RepID=UPI002E80FBED|nr:hypothetical protein [Cyanobacterium sp. Dongsha4]WVL00759.1 hypothetical protein Dongsha4_00740 [Cyanobacterium sp. Dongsha4]
MNNKKNYLIILISLIFTLIFSLKVRAKVYSFDFEKDLEDNYLDPFVLDTYEDSEQNSVGTIWKSRGIIISTKDTNKPVGLFQSNCIPTNGVSLTAKEKKCQEESYGNNGLATGEGKYFLKSNQISYKTEPQGNILIIENTPGNGIPEDSPDGGKIRFDFDRTLLSNVVVDKIGIVDHAKGNILVKYIDGEEYIKTIHHKQRNQLEFYEIPSGEIEYIEVTFQGNGGITEITFDKLIALETANNLFSSFTVPSLIIGGLGTFGIIGNQNENKYSDVFEPFFSEDKKNYDLLDLKIVEKDGHHNNNNSSLNPNNSPPKIEEILFNNSSEVTTDEREENAVSVPEPPMFMATLIALVFGKIIKQVHIT